MSASKEAKPDAVTAKANSAQEFSTDLLRVYYQRLFPYDEMFNWLSYGNDPNKSSSNAAIEKDFFSKREWSFTIEDDIYIRYQSFRDKNELIQAIQKRQPHKIDIGAVFTASPKDHNVIAPEKFTPESRELVFDIDMTDYDTVRVCCEGANICMKCWPYMTMAVKVCDQTLREDFGFSNILWLYSGRRGVHCWVCDPEARSLSNEARSALVDYMTVETGSKENSDSKVKKTFTHIHPMMRRAYDTLEPMFAQHIADGAGQGLFATKRRYMIILNELPNEAIRKELFASWESNADLSGRERWKQMEAAVTEEASGNLTLKQEQALKKRKTSAKINYAELEAWKYELVFTHCYPRLDANVSKTMNHLLKAPFCVHPKTGRVCVSIDPANVDAFDPFAVPTVRSLCAEIDAYDKLHGAENETADGTASPNSSSSKVTDIQKTSLKGAIDIFNKTFMQNMWGRIRRDMREKLDEVNARNVDF